MALPGVPPRSGSSTLSTWPPGDGATKGGSLGEGAAMRGDNWLLWATTLSGTVGIHTLEYSLPGVTSASSHREGKNPGFSIGGIPKAGWIVTHKSELRRHTDKSWVELRVRAQGFGPQHWRPPRKQAGRGI